MSEFRTVPGFEEYEVSASAVCRRIGGAELTPLQNSTGYVRFSVRRTSTGKTKSLLAHRAVALAWIGPPPDDAPCVAHLDGDRRNNHLSNLQWVSYRENETHKEGHGTKLRGIKNPCCKLNDDQVYDARYLHSRGHTFAGIAALFSVSTTTIKDAVRGLTWAHVAFPPSLALRPTHADRASVIEALEPLPEGHTPGPWRVEPEYPEFVYGNGGLVAEAMTDSHDENYANATLIVLAVNEAIARRALSGEG